MSTITEDDTELRDLVSKVLGNELYIFNSMRKRSLSLFANLASYLCICYYIVTASVNNHNIIKEAGLKISVLDTKFLITDT